MPPKKGNKAKKKASSKVHDSLKDLLVPYSSDSLLDKELDYLFDLNDDFFLGANKVIQNLMVSGKHYEATKIKKYLDIVYNLHRKYVDEVNENEILRPKMLDAENKLRLALELTINSQEAMDQLKEALGEAWRESDASQMREQDIQEKMQELIIKCESFENKESEKQDDSAEFGHLAKYKNIILRERDRISGEVVDLEKRLQMQRYYSESLEYFNKSMEDNMTKMSMRVRVLETEKSSMDIKINTLMSNLEDQKDTNAKTLQKLESTHRELNDTQVKLQKKIADFDRQKLILEKFKNENTVFSRTISKYEEDIVEFRKDARENDETIKSLRLEDKVKANTISQLNTKYKKAVQDHNVISSKLYKLNRLNHSLNEEIMRMKNQINALEKDLLSSTYKYDDLRRLKENIQRERENLRSDIIKLNNTQADLRHTIMIQSNTMDNLRLDINKLNVKLDEAKINISKAEKERDEMAQEMETLHERIEYYQEQIQLRTDQVTDLTEKLTQKNHTLINVKNQLEAAHSEKNLLRRSLDTCTQERDNFRVLQAKTSHQIAQLTNEIVANQNRINSLNLNIERLNSEKKELETELNNTQNLLAKVRKELKDMKKKNESLLKTIVEDEHKFKKLAQELDETRKEKNLIGLQMVRRNDEIVLLKEKIHIMQMTLDQGQTQYNQRVTDVRLLKVEITNLQTERDCLHRAVKSTADMRMEVIRLQRTLNQERVKVRSLTEDAKIPTSVHRWRILKGEDPTRLELLEKVQILQKRNLKQEIAQNNLQRELDESHRVADGLKKVVENLPTTTIKQKLVETQRINIRQLKQLKALKAELAIDEIELKARECVIEQFKEELNFIKQGQGCEEPPTASIINMIEPAANEGTFEDCVFEVSDESNIKLVADINIEAEKLSDN